MGFQKNPSGVSNLSTGTDLASALAAKAALAGATYTGTHDFTGATVTGIGSGLVLVAASTFSAVSAVNVNSCFTATYSDYKIMLSLTASSANTAMSMRMRASGADNTTASYVTQFLVQDGAALTGIGSSTTAWYAGYVATSYPESASTQMDIKSPQLARRTLAVARGTHTSSTNVTKQEILSMWFAAATQFDGFSIYPDSGTFTGTVRVYGYQSA